MKKKQWVIKADFENYPHCTDDEYGIYVDQDESNYTTLEEAKKYDSQDAARRAIAEVWEVVEEIE